ncbi:MAG: leucine-rich repeat domain-containing protein [Candidatus Thorarchaeota archaeon]|jgi:hypothetical protein
MDEIYIRYITTTGLERTAGFRTDVEEISLDLRDMESVDLLPLIWCVKMKTLNIRNNRLTTIDLTPLSRCVNLEALRLNNNLLSEINLTPLSDCPHMQEVDIRGNKIRSIDLSPLFHCTELIDLKLDDEISLTADLLLRSIGSWPDVLVNKFHKILWKVSEES